MTRAASQTIFTPDDLLRMPDAVNFELVDGQLVERNMGLVSSLVGMSIGAELRAYVRRSGGGHVFGSDAGYRCYPDAPDKVRKPDVSFVRSGRFTDERVPEGYADLAPDLAVEVISPNDLAYNLTEKVEEYLAAGVKLVWVVDPHTRTVQVHRPPTSPAGRLSGFGGSDVITGEDVLAGFTCPVSNFFASP